MKHSTERFLTTHTGSLPRPDDLVRMMYAKEEGVPVDAAALAGRVRAAVADVVRKQRDAGVDLVNDGEVSKPSYATYIKDRLDGFGGTAIRSCIRIWPNFRASLSACSATRAGHAARRRPATRRSACAMKEPR
jgi:methionine synthase II (cobalamin-independent)